MAVTGHRARANRVAPFVAAVAVVVALAGCTNADTSKAFYPPVAAYDQNALLAAERAAFTQQLLESNARIQAENARIHAADLAPTWNAPVAPEPFHHVATGGLSPVPITINPTPVAPPAIPRPLPSIEPPSLRWPQPAADLRCGWWDVCNLWGGS